VCKGFRVAQVLFVCTGNLCRSPSAALLLRRQLGEVGAATVSVSSAGTLEAEVGPPSLLVEEGGRFGIDLGSHVARLVDPAMIEEADLVIGLAREHVREVVVAAPDSFPKSFTLREIARRGQEVGPRGETEDLQAWLARLMAGRQRRDLMGDSPSDDIADPMGGTSADYRQMLDEVSALTLTLRELAWPSRATPLLD
jgi:protein-tyrosine phosphatase